MEHEKYSYVEALTWLAQKYNVEIEETEKSPEQKLQQQASESLYAINNFAQKYFSDILFNSEEGQDIGLSYLKQRGFREDIIKKFQIGYNKEARDEFATTALKSQYDLTLLQKSGLVVMRNEMPADNYHGRIIFPVHNQSGKIIGFGARIIKRNDKAPKYINTPENEIYVKSRILYGSYFARVAIDKADECLLVEGYTDVVSLHQAGIENVVASGGTSLTHDQLRLIKKYTNFLTIIYDGDNAGIKAALRGLDLALEEGLNVNLVLIPDGEDPDSYVYKVGAESFREFIAGNKKDVILFQLEIALKDAANDSNKKVQVVNQIAETISKINKPEDFTKRNDYIKRCSELLKIDENGLTTLVNKFVREKIQKEQNQISSIENLNLPVQSAEEADEETLELFNRDELQVRAMVRSLVEFGLNDWTETQKVADYIFSEIEANELRDLIKDPALLKILDMYKTWYDEKLEPTARNFFYLDDRELSSYVVGLIEFKHEISPNWKDKYEVEVATRENLYQLEVASTLNYLKLKKIKVLVAENLKDIEKETNPDEHDNLLQTHHHLKQLEMELTKQMGTVILK